MLSHLKKTIRTALFIIVLTLPVAVFAQKLQKVIDKISSETTFITSQKRIASTADIFAVEGNVLGADVEKTKGAFYLNLELDVLGDYGRFYADSGSSVILKLKNNYLIQLSSLYDEWAKFRTIDLVSSSQSYWTANLSYNISPGDIEKILSSDIIMIRITTDKQNFDFDIKPKNSAVIKKMLAMIVNAR